MKSRLIAVLAAAALATSVAAAESTTPAQSPPQTQLVPPPQIQQAQKPVEMTLTGCVIQGSGPDVFLLDNARRDPRDASEKGQTFVLASGVQDMDFTGHLNHEVTVTGTVDPTPAAPPPPPLERDLPRLSATLMTHVADQCTHRRR